MVGRPRNALIAARTIKSFASYQLTALTSLFASNQFHRFSGDLTGGEQFLIFLHPPEISGKALLRPPSTGRP